MLSWLLHKYYDKKLNKEKELHDESHYESQKRIEELSDLLVFYEKRLESIIETQHEMVCRFSSDTTLTFVNDAYCRSFGFSEKELLNKQFIEFVPDEDKHLVIENLKNLSVDNPVNLVLHKVILKDGQIRWHEWSDTIVTDNDDNIIEYQSVGRDVTDRIHLEQRLKQQQALLDSVLEVQTDYVVRYDLNRKIIYANSVYCDLLSEGNTCLGEYVRTDKVYYQDVKNYNDYLETLKHSPHKAEMDLRILMPNNDYHWFHVVGRGILDNDNSLIEIQSIGRDVNDKKLLEKRLSEKNKFLNNILESSTDLISRINLNFEITYANQAYQKTFFRDDENYLGINFLEHHVHPDYQDYIKNLEPVFSKPPHRFKTEWLSKTINGEYRWFHIEVVGILGDNGNSGKVVEVQTIARDITELKTSIDKIKENEKFLNSLIDSIPTPVFYKDINGRYLGFNKNFIEFFNKDSNDLIGKTVFDIYPKEKAEIHYEMETQLFKKTGKCVYQTQFIDSDNNVLDIVLHKATLVNTKNEIIGLVGVIIDITEQTQILELLKESEDKYKKLIETTSTGYVIISSSGIVIDANVEYLKMTGYSSLKDIIGQSILKWTDPECFDKNKEAIIACANGDLIKDLEITYIQPDQTKVFIDVNATCVNDDIILSICKDVTSYKCIENALLKSKEKYKKLQQLFRSVADIMPDMLWAKDLDKNYIFVNKSICEKLLNVDNTDEPIGKSDIYFSELNKNPDNPDWNNFGEICLKSDNIVLSQKKTGRFEEIGNINGEKVCLDVIKTPLLDNSGEMVGVVGCGRDITDKKELENKLNRQNKLFDSILEAQTDFIVRCDKDHNITYYNSVFSSVFDSREKIDLSLLHEDDRDSLKKFINNVTRSPYHDVFDCRIKTNGNEYRSFHINGTGILDNDNHISEIQLVGRDLTCKQQMYQKLNHQNQLLKNIIDSQSDCIFRCVLNRLINYSNKIFSDLFCGVDNDTDICEDLDFINYVYMQDRELVKEVIHNVIHNEPHKDTVDFRVEDINNTVRFYRWKIYGLINANKVFELQFVGYDIINGATGL